MFITSDNVSCAANDSRFNHHVIIWIGIDCF